MIETTDLKVIPIFQDIPLKECIWLAEQTEEKQYESGAKVFSQGEKVEHFIMILQGNLNLVRYEQGKEEAAFQMETGELTGLLPFSRMVVNGASAYAAGSTRLGWVDARLFKVFHEKAPTLLERLVNYMLDRTRLFTRAGADREKLVSLGTMSAGLAHELNNPASAAKRAAQNLQTTLQAFDEHSSTILKPILFRDTVTEDPFTPLYQAMTLDGERLSSLERSDLEDDLADWLEPFGVQEAWDTAATLVAGGLTRAHLEETASKLHEAQILNFLNWVPKDVELRLLAKELIESTSRISDLVNAMKAYTYMDRGQDKQATDLHDGIINTLIILKHKWQTKNIKIVKEFAELPAIPAYGSELNQVWTNLIANAIDAVEDSGIITLKTHLDLPANTVVVDIIDNGRGIPKDIQSRIFEPFYTTKGVGEGTGMGLDIVNRIIRQRHRGTVSLESEPGATCFRVRLPLI